MPTYWRLCARSLHDIISGVKTFQILILVAAAFRAFADGQPFERYQTIIDRKPFGPEPANFDPEAVPGTASSGVAGGGELTPEQRSAEAQQLAAKVRVSVLNVTPSGVIKVGFTDSSANPVENYYLKVGASQNGWTVKSADPATESVTLAKDGVEVTMKLGESVGGKGANAPSSKRRGLLGRSNGVQTLQSAQPVALSAEPAQDRAVGGLARLRQMRMAARAKEQADAAKRREEAAAAEAERKEREANEAAERQRAEEERAQQREALLQIQEQLRKQREEREAAKNNRQEEQGEADNAE